MRASEEDAALGTVNPFAPGLGPIKRKMIKSLFLFGRDYGILEGFGHPHFNNGLGRNFNGFAGLRIPTGTGFAFGKDEFAELFFLLGWDLGSK